MRTDGTLPKNVEYLKLNIADIDVNIKEVTTKFSKDPIKRVDNLVVGGQKMKPDSRFWNSLGAHFGINSSIFKYFNHDEVFDRVRKRHRTNGDIRLCVADDRVLSVSKQQSPIVDYQMALRLMQKHKAQHLEYREGCLVGELKPTSGHGTVQIGPDDFQNRHMMEIPIDGYGKPKSYLEMLRMICTNGMVGYNPAFASPINLGGDPEYTLNRIMESYDNDEGFTAMQQKLVLAQQSLASMRECNMVGKALKNNGVGSTVLSNYWEATGDMVSKYGLVNIEALSESRQRVLPSKATVYDLLNFVSEVSTHKAKGNDRGALQATIGQLLATDYDLEGSAEEITDFDDFFMKESKAAAQEAKAKNKAKVLA